MNETTRIIGPVSAGVADGHGRNNAAETMIFNLDLDEDQYVPNIGTIAYLRNRGLFYHMDLRTSIQ